jgi:hypothetical protein
MCFDTDCDWDAEVYASDVQTAEKRRRCMECRRFIEPDQQYRNVYLQQYEYCRTCDPDQDGLDCSCGEPTFGETFDYHCCLDCDRFLEAIASAEREEGCHYSESRPRLEEMREALRDAGREAFERYAAKAREMHPDLESGGYLAWLRHELYEDDE